MQNLWKLMEKLLKWLLFQDTNTFTIFKWFVPLMVLYVCLTTMDLLGYLYLQFCYSRCCLISQKLSPWWGAFIWSCFWPPVINEYKVFWFFYARSQYQGVSRQCKIYSSIPGSWKPIGCKDIVPWVGNMYLLMEQCIGSSLVQKRKQHILAPSLL